jgi:hypothetical protein
MLNAVQSFDGEPEILKIHWDGLIQLVEMAGGLRRLGLCGITRRSALWYVTSLIPNINWNFYVVLVSAS